MRWEISPGELVELERDRAPIQTEEPRVGLEALVSRNNCVQLSPFGMVMGDRN